MPSQLNSSESIVAPQDIVESALRHKLEQAIEKMIFSSPGEIDSNLEFYLNLAREHGFTDLARDIEQYTAETLIEFLKEKKKKRTRSAREEHLEDFLMKGNNLELVEPGLTALDRQVTLPSGGILDILARDVSGNETVVELKAEEYRSPSVFEQLRGYLAETGNRTLLVAPKVNPDLFYSLIDQYDQGSLDFHLANPVTEGEEYKITPFNPESIPKEKRKPIDWTKASKKRKPNGKVRLFGSGREGTTSTVKTLKDKSGEDLEATDFLPRPNVGPLPDGYPIYSYAMHSLGYSKNEIDAYIESGIPVTGSQKERLMKLKKIKRLEDDVHISNKINEIRFDKESDQSLLDRLISQYPQQDHRKIFRAVNSQREDKTLREVKEKLFYVEESFDQESTPEDRIKVAKENESVLESLLSSKLYQDALNAINSHTSGDYDPRRVFLRACVIPEIVKINESEKLRAERAKALGNISEDLGYTYFWTRGFVDSKGITLQSNNAVENLIASDSTKITLIGELPSNATQRASLSAYQMIYDSILENLVVKEEPKVIKPDPTPVTRQRKPNPTSPKPSTEPETHESRYDATHDLTNAIGIRNTDDARYESYRGSAEALIEDIVQARYNTKDTKAFAKSLRQVGFRKKLGNGGEAPDPIIFTTFVSDVNDNYVSKGLIPGEQDLASLYEKVSKEFGDKI